MTAQHTALELNQAIRKAQSAPLFDPRFASLEKSSFSQSASATSGLTYYDLGDRRQTALSGADAAAQFDPARLRQGRHSGRLARHHGDQFHRPARRRFRRQSRRRRRP